MADPPPPPPAGLPATPSAPSSPSAPPDHDLRPQPGHGARGRYGGAGLESASWSSEEASDGSESRSSGDAAVSSRAQRRGRSGRAAGAAAAAPRAPRSRPRARPAAAAGVSKIKAPQRWTQAEHDLLVQVRCAAGRGAAGAAGRGWPAAASAGLRAQVVARAGNTRKWAEIAKAMPGRTGKQCRERYVNHTAPDAKRGTWGVEEELELCTWHSIVGSHWSRITRRLEGRTENAVKNHWAAAMRAKVHLRAAAGAVPRARCAGSAMRMPMKRRTPLNIYVGHIRSGVAPPDALTLVLEALQEAHPELVAATARASADIQARRAADPAAAAAAAAAGAAPGGLEQPGGGGAAPAGRRRAPRRAGAHPGAPPAKQPRLGAAAGSGGSSTVSSRGGSPGEPGGSGAASPAEPAQGQPAAARGSPPWPPLAGRVAAGLGAGAFHSPTDPSSTSNTSCAPGNGRAAAPPALAAFGHAALELGGFQQTLQHSQHHQHQLQPFAHQLYYELGQPFQPYAHAYGGAAGGGDAGRVWAQAQAMAGEALASVHAAATAVLTDLGMAPHGQWLDPAQPPLPRHLPAGLGGAPGGGADAAAAAAWQQWQQRQHQAPPPAALQLGGGGAAEQRTPHRSVSSEGFDAMLRTGTVLSPLPGTPISTALARWADGDGSGAGGAWHGWPRTVTTGEHPAGAGGEHHHRALLRSQSERFAAPPRASLDILPLQLPPWSAAAAAAGGWPASGSWTGGQVPLDRTHSAPAFRHHAAPLQRFGSLGSGGRGAPPPPPGGAASPGLPGLAGLRELELPEPELDDQALLDDMLRAGSE
ncbi:MYB98 [Scenedesmus sp. PABB004]|nr:MYB98 [Scenedesmus sp. PABB004]